MAEKPAPNPAQKDWPEKDRRVISRTSIVCPALYQAFQNNTAAGPVYNATVLDLNIKGVRIRGPFAPAIGDPYRLTIHLPGEKQTIQAICRAARVEEEELGRTYQIGFSFEEMESSGAVEALQRLESLDLRRLLENLLTVKGSDLHLTCGQPPIARVRGHLVLLKQPAFQPNEIGSLVYGILTDRQIAVLEEKRELDFAYSLALDKRFRFNLHWQRGQVEAAVRVIPAEVTSCEKLEIPPVVVEWARKANGLILIVGPTGSGKTTTLSSLVDRINEERDAVIICLERPIEYLHRNKKAIIKQREVGSDTLSFAEAVRRALRQDPDVIVVGEVEDAETVNVVLNAAETGNLVLASFHATNTIQALDRFMSLCPAQQRPQIAFQLASLLRGVLTQHLIPKEQAMGGGLALATEVFVPTEAGRNHIRNNTLPQLYSVIETGSAHQMHTLDRSINQLHSQGLISTEIAESLLALVGQQT